MEISRGRVRLLKEKGRAGLKEGNGPQAELMSMADTRKKGARARRLGTPSICVINISSMKGGRACLPRNPVSLGAGIPVFRSKSQS